LQGIAAMATPERCGQDRGSAALIGKSVLKFDPLKA